MKIDVKLELTRIAVQQRARAEDNWVDVSGSRVLQIAHTAKAVICIVLGRELDAADSYLHEDGVRIADWNFRRTYDFDYGKGADWECLYVGHGLRNWWYYTMSDGYP